MYQCQKKFEIQGYFILQNKIQKKERTGTKWQTTNTKQNRLITSSIRITIAHKHTQRTVNTTAPYNREPSKEDSPGSLPFHLLLSGHMFLPVSNPLYRECYIHVSHSLLKKHYFSRLTTESYNPFSVLCPNFL